MPLGPRLQELRERLALSQAEVADGFGVSQSMISLLENDRRPVKEQRQYLSYLQRTLDNREKKAAFSALEFLDCEGPRLFSDDALRRKIPVEWNILGVTRCSAKHELAFVYEPVRDVTGFVALYRNSSGELKRTSVVPFEPLYHRYSSIALIRFLSGHYHASDKTGDDLGGDDDEPLSDMQLLLKRGTWEQRLLEHIRALKKQRFELDEIYRLEPQFRKLFPNHKNIKAGLRYTLQRLRDRGYVDFLGGGRYELSVIE